MCCTEIEARVHTFLFAYVRPVVIFGSKTTHTRLAMCRNVLECVIVCCSEIEVVCCSGIEAVCCSEFEVRVDTFSNASLSHIWQQDKTRSCCSVL